MLQSIKMNSGKTLVIAEIGTSHGGSLEKAKKLIDGAKEAGADIIKFQWVYAEEILHPNTGFVNLPTGKIPLYERFKELEVKPEFFRDCLEYTKRLGAKFMCSPFGLRSLHELIQIQPDYIKIASPELNHYPLLKELKNSNPGIPVVLSSGVSTKEDIQKALRITGTKNVTLLHCITSYPAPEDEYNVRLINTLSRDFNIAAGISDHSLDPVLVPCLAVSQGAQMIEKHITLSKETDGLDDPVALDLEQFAHMCFCVHQSDAVLRHYGFKRGQQEIITQMEDQYGTERVQKVLGSGIKKLAPSEEANYGRTNRSCHFMGDFSKGHVIQKGDVEVLRTEKVLSVGIGPEFYESLTGKVLTRDVENGAGVQEEDFKL